MSRRYCLRGGIRMKIIRVKDYDEMSQKACELVSDQILKQKNSVLGLATGSTPEGMYEGLIEKTSKKEISFKDVRTFNLDEYIGLSEEDPNSYHYFMEENFFKRIDISPDHTHLPKGKATDLQAECQRYEDLIESVGGIDLQILGLGTNGHIAFNEPGSSFKSPTAVVDLAQETLDANARFFDSVEEVPTQAITMGIASIMKAGKIILLVSGESKAEALKQTINGEVTEDVPSSVLKNHSNVTIIADEAALSLVE